MLIKFLSFIIYLLVLSCNVLSKEPDPYVIKLQEKKILKMPDDKELILVRLFNDIGPSNHMRLFLRKSEKMLWDVTYNNDLGTLWADAHFIPLYDKEFISDLDGDSFPEVAIAVWHGGNAVQHCRAIIFSVKEDRLSVLATREINYEFSYSVFKEKKDFINSSSKL